VFQEAVGAEMFNWVFNLILLLIGMVMLIRKHTAKALLVIIPILAALFAAALHQYSLIPRLALFMMPLLLVLVGYGFEQLFTKKILVWNTVLVLLALVCAVWQNNLKMI